jgi:hypothetical protein
MAARFAVPLDGSPRPRTGVEDGTGENRQAVETAAKTEDAEEIHPPRPRPSHPPRDSLRDRLATADQGTYGSTYGVVRQGE